jgi:hypothetical protein
MSGLLHRLFLASGLLLVWAAPALAQRVEVRGRGDLDNDAFLRSLVAAGDYQLIARDTLVARNDTIHGTTLVLSATLRLDGVIAGDLVVVDANVFMRPTARVLGTIHNIGGGFYPSELAVVEGGTRSEPNARYIVQERGDTFVILGTAQPSVWVRPGVFGFAAPTYDRVDGLTLSYGTGILLPRAGRVEPLVRGWIDYRSQRGAITGGAEVVLPRGGTEFVVGAERTTVTNERWIRGDLDNSISFLFLGKDYRDYFAVDRGFAELRRTLEQGPRTTTAFVRAQVEDARTLHAGTPWTLSGTPRTDNIAVDGGRISSLLGGSRMAWDHPLHLIRLEGQVEAAGAVLDGAHTFLGYSLDVDWAMAAFADHTLRVQAHGQGPLPGTDSLPRQRWSYVGGSGTLYTFDLGEFRGDRVVFVETRYIVRLHPLRLRVLGTPDLELLHLTGMAWTADESRPLEQNVGVRLRFSLANIRFLTNPADFRSDRQISVGLNLPRRAYPWERRADEARQR